MTEFAAEKVCSKCRETKFLSEFAPGNTKQGVASACRVCMRVVNKSWYEAGGWQRQRARREIDRGKLLRYYAKKRSASKGLAYDLDEHKVALEQRVLAGYCELTGMPFDFAGSQTFYSPSIDRKEPALGYTYENIRVIAFGMNVAINQWGEDVLREAVIAWLER